MSNGQESINSRELLERLAREGSQKEREVSIVTSPGARESGWAVKVKSHSSYNVYNVIAVEIGSAGSLPIEIGQQMQAVNLAESFLQEGTLSVGTYAAMLRVGAKNVFYTEP
jgi:hypothetical protein